MFQAYPLTFYPSSNHQGPNLKSNFLLYTLHLLRLGYMEDNWICLGEKKNGLYHLEEMSGNMNKNNLLSLSNTSKR